MRSMSSDATSETDEHFSPDGRSLAFELEGRAASTSNLALMDLATGSRRPATAVEEAFTC